MNKTEACNHVDASKAGHPAETNTASSRQSQTDTIHFGTDGWRAIIDADFNPRSLARVADAAARVYAEQLAAGDGAWAQRDAAASDGAESDSPKPASDDTPAARPAILVGYDCRRDAGRYAVLAATVLAAQGFDAIVSDRYCPTPALCWTIANSPRIVGGLMLTSSHNPAEYLGLKLRMSDGGASPQDFTDLVEQALHDGPPECFDAAMANFAAAVSGTPEQPATGLPDVALPAAALPAVPAVPAVPVAPAVPAVPATPAAPAAAPAATLRFQDIMSGYLSALRSAVDEHTIKRASLRIVIDPMFGAGRGYLAGLLRDMGVEVTEVNAANDPSFNGLHPEPIMPWISVGAEKVAELGYDACFVTDGDADRIGAVDESGSYVSSHRVLALLIAHLVEDKGQSGRVIRTRAGSNLLRRQCQRLGLELCSKPIGFKWIYQEMLQGDVLIGGEESGGIGIPGHVRERDGLLMALLLTELMAEKGRGLRQLVAEMLEELGTLEYARRDLQLSDGQKQALLKAHVQNTKLDVAGYQALFTALGEELTAVSGGDGIKFDMASDAWLLVRPSGTEPLVRIYAEAADSQQVEELLDIGCALAQG